MIVAELSRVVDAPVETVFNTVGKIGNWAKANPEIDGVEYLTKHDEGLGVRFIEKRRLTGWAAVVGRWFGATAVEHEVVEFVNDRRVRYVSDELGALWSSTFIVTRVDGGTEGRTRLDIVVEAEAHSIVGRLVPFLTRRVARTKLGMYLDSAKAHMEAACPDCGEVGS
ncbi:MAG: SRPBCC family protein [Chloroflexi bacterium]|nr:SRPBCC family protein [Chloroflexota bacterium]